jgi:hypothetical protein
LKIKDVNETSFMLEGITIGQHLRPYFRLALLSCKMHSTAIAGDKYEDMVEAFATWVPKESIEMLGDELCKYYVLCTQGGVRDLSDPVYKVYYARDENFPMAGTHKYIPSTVDSKYFRAMQVVKTAHITCAALGIATQDMIKTHKREMKAATRDDEDEDEESQLTNKQTKGATGSCDKDSSASPNSIIEETTTPADDDDEDGATGSCDKDASASSNSIIEETTNLNLLAAAATERDAKQSAEASNSGGNAGETNQESDDDGCDTHQLPNAKEISDANIVTPINRQTPRRFPTPICVVITQKKSV